MDTFYLGIDIAKHTFDVALCIDNKYKHKVFANTPAGFEQLTQWLLQKAITHVHACLEATGNYGEALACYLFERGFKVSLINPAQIKAFAQSQLTRNKTDKIDAKLIVLFGQRMQPALWQPTPKPVRELQALVARLEDLLSLVNQEENRLQVAHISIISSIQNTLSVIRQEIEAIKASIKKHINQYPELRKQQQLLKTIPGIGETTIARLLTFLHDSKRFENAKKVTAFVGLNPRQINSGVSVKGKSHLSKTGSAYLRKALFMPALVAIRYNKSIKIFAERLKQLGKSKMVIVGAVMRKLLHIIYGVLKSGKPFDAALCLSKT